MKVYVQTRNDVGQLNDNCAPLILAHTLENNDACICIVVAVDSS